MTLSRIASNDYARLNSSEVDGGDAIVHRTTLYGIGSAALVHAAPAPATDYQPYPASIELSSLDGSNGFKLLGAATDRVGFASAGGDVNGDGFSDLIIGAYAEAYGIALLTGRSYVVFGKAGGGFGATVDLSTIAYPDGFQVSNLFANYQELGFSVRSVGDFNGDGIDDFAVGAPFTNKDNSTARVGATYLVFGNGGGFVSELKVGDPLLLPTGYFRLTGAAAGQTVGFSVAGGDINGDGFSDLIATSTGGSSNGTAYVVFGGSSFSTTLSSSLSVSALNGTNGFAIVGAAAGDSLGQSVSTGDVNGDGIDDIVLGASFADPNGTSSGSAYVVFGSHSAFAASMNVSTLNGTNGFLIKGLAADDRLGVSVSRAGDINGDGVADLIVGAHHADPNARTDSGASYVVFGTAGGFPASFDVSGLTGSNGFRIDGAAAGDRSGRTVASAGDVNGDGFDDILVGASYAQPHGVHSGAAYVIFGRAGGFSANFDLSSLNGTNGFALNGEAAGDLAGSSVSSAGDLNGDGFSDIIIGAPATYNYGSPPPPAGATYVVYGRAPNAAVNHTGTAASQTLAGGAFNDTLDGQGGNDNLYGNGGNDTLTGGSGADTFHFSAAGPANVDTVTDFSTAQGDRIDLTGLLDAHTIAAHVSDYVRFVVTNVTDLTVQVDTDGTGGGATWSDVAVLTGAAALTPTIKVGSAVINQYSSGNDVIVGAATGNQLFDLSAGGNDTVTGGAGNDGFSFGATLTGLDVIDGGAGSNDQIAVQGDYSGGLLLSGSSISHVEALAMLPGFNYSFTTDDSFITGTAFKFWAPGLSAANHVSINASAETAANVSFYLGAGNDTAVGGGGADNFYGGAGSDNLTGGAGADVFEFSAVSESTSTGFDVIHDFQAGTDSFLLHNVGVGQIDTEVGGGALLLASFDAGLESAIGAAQLGAGHAVLFTQTGGDFSGHKFLIVDANGIAGYQTAADYVFDVTGITGTLGIFDFVP